MTIYGELERKIRWKYNNNLLELETVICPHLLPSMGIEYCSTLNQNLLCFLLILGWVNKIAFHRDLNLILMGIQSDILFHWSFSSLSWEDHTFTSLISTFYGITVKHLQKEKG